MPQYEFDPAALDTLPAGQRAKALALMAAFKDKRESNPLEVMMPYPKQAAFLRAILAARIAAFFGGNRAGKTTIGVTSDLLEVTPFDLVPAHLREFKHESWHCPRYIRCIAPSTKLLRSVFVEKFREWTPRELLKAGRFSDAYSKYEGVLTLECGCRVDFLSYEMDLDKFGGSALHRVHYDEEPPEEIREESRARLTDFGGREIFTMTPLQGMSWMYDGVWHRAGRDPHVQAVVASLVENPYLDPEGVKATIEEYAGNPEQLAARVHGQFVHFGGLVYPSWRDWIGDPIPTDVIRHGDVIVGIDPGVLGFGLVATVFDALNNEYVFWAKRMADSDVADAVKVIRQMLTSYGLLESDVQFVIDPAARSRTAISSATIESEFANHGIYCNHGQNEREAGVMLIRRRGAKGRLAIGRDCVDLIWELERYRIQEREDGKFDVVKRNDHCADALRYASMERPYDEEPELIRSGFAADVATPPPRRQPSVSVMGPLA